jgi:hypothetical protein
MTHFQPIVLLGNPLIISMWRNAENSAANCEILCFCRFEKIVWCRFPIDSDCAPQNPAFSDHFRKMMFEAFNRVEWKGDFFENFRVEFLSEPIAFIWRYQWIRIINGMYSMNRDWYYEFNTILMKWIFPVDWRLFLCTLNVSMQRDAKCNGKWSFYSKFLLPHSFSNFRVIFSLIYSFLLPSVFYMSILRK